MLVLKMLCLYVLCKNSLHLTFEPYLRSETYSRKYEKLSVIVIMHVKILSKKGNCWKCVTRKFGFVYLRFDPLRWNSLTTIVTLSWLGGAEVTHPIWVVDAPDSIPGSGKGFYVWFFVLLLLLCFSFVCTKTHYLSQNIAISFAMLIYLVYLTYCTISDRL